MRLNPTHLDGAARAWRARIAALAIAVALPVLAGCGAGTNAQTNQQYDPAAGVNVREGSVYAINTLVVANDSGQGTLVAALVNQVDKADRLTSVSATDNAGKALQATITAGGVDLPGRQAVQLASDGTVSISGDGLKPGTFIDLHLGFASGSPIDLKVPVLTHEGDYASVPITSSAS